ncbi:MAG: LamG-like jellyroll fold domain-containing protein [Candidatus Paceibacterota bacterium]
MRPENGFCPDISSYGLDAGKTGFSGNEFFVREVIGNGFFATRVAESAGYLTVANAAQNTFTKTQPFSLNCITKGQFNVSSNGYFYKLSGTKGYVFQKRNTGGLQATIYDGTGGYNAVTSSTYWASTVGYHMITFTYNGVNAAGMKVYIDGTDFSSGRTETLVGDINVATTLYLGFCAPSDSIKMYHPSIYNRELSAGEVSSLYKAYQKSAVVFKAAYEGVSTTGNINTADAPLDKTPFKVSWGTWKISSDTIKGISCKVVENVVTGYAYMDASLLNQGLSVPEGKYKFSVYPISTSSHDVIFQSATSGTNPNNNLYIRFGNNDVIFRKSGVATYITAAGAGVPNMWHDVEVDLTTNNYARLWVDGVNYGGTTIGTTFPTTSLPVSKYFSISLSAGAKFLYASADGSMGLIKYALP